MSFTKDLTAEQILEMEAEELAPFLLRYLKTQQSINRYNFTLNNDSDLQQRLGRRYEEYLQVLMESWMWLEREGLIAPKPGHQNDWAFVTRKGQRVLDAQDFDTYKKASLFPSELDPALTRYVKPLFIRGDYDTAVFRAFKEVETRVRKKANLPPTCLGVDLMNTAFGDKGSLTDTNAPKAEQQRMRDLFAGAVGLFKNPSSHRDVNFDDPREVIDIIATANQLLRIVNRL